MKPLLRTIGMAVLVAALLNASAGLCFCHRGPAAPGAEPESAACCHGPQAPAGTVIDAPASCCHIESADSAATPVAAVQLAPPATVSLAVTNARPAAELLPVAAAATSFASPPILALRI
jgi:hypothetical protein